MQAQMDHDKAILQVSWEVCSQDAIQE
jgi:hypothetical protein